MPTVSVIIPAYNGTTRYLDEAIRSVLAQTYKDRELIIVDDASTDRTAELIRQFPQTLYHRHSSNRGQAAARNQGARLATGHYLAFLDQDDLWEPTFLQETTAVMNQHPDVALVHSDGYQVDEWNVCLEYDGAIKFRQTITQILRGGHDVATSGSLIRKTIFEQIGGYDETLTIWEDIDLAIRVYRRHRLLHLPQPLYRHRLYNHNASRDIPSERALQSRKRFIDKYASICSHGSLEEQALAQDRAGYYGDLGKHLHRIGRPAEARTAYIESLRLAPFNYKTLLRLLRSYFTFTHST